MNTSMLRPGDIIFFQGKSFISRGIRMFSGSKFSHVALYVGDGYVIEATAAGVEKNAVAPLIAHSTHTAVGRIPNLTVEQQHLMVDKAYSMIGDKYDVWQLLTFSVYFAFRKIGIIWPALIGDKAGAVVCSALVAICCMTIPLKFGKTPKTSSPESLYSSGKIDIILEEENK